MPGLPFSSLVSSSHCWEAENEISVFYFLFLKTAFSLWDLQLFKSIWWCARTHQWSIFGVTMLNGESHIAGTPPAYTRTSLKKMNCWNFGNPSATGVNNINMLDRDFLFMKDLCRILFNCHGSPIICRKDLSSKKSEDNFFPIEQNEPLHFKQSTSISLFSNWIFMIPAIDSQALARSNIYYLYNN